MPSIQSNSSNFVKTPDCLLEVSQGLNELIAFREQFLPSLIQFMKAEKEDEDTIMPIVSSLAQLPSSAIPVQPLIEILQETVNSSSRLCLAWVLGHTGSTSEVVVKAFVDALKGPVRPSSEEIGILKLEIPDIQIPQDPRLVNFTLLDHNISLAAAAMLPAFPSIYIAVTDYFITELISSSGNVQKTAAIALGMLGEDAQKAIPDNIRDTFLRLIKGNDWLSNSAAVEGSASNEPWYCSWEYLPERLRWKCIS